MSERALAVLCAKASNTQLLYKHRVHRNDKTLQVLLTNFNGILQGVNWDGVPSTPGGHVTNFLRNWGTRFNSVINTRRHKPRVMARMGLDSAARFQVWNMNLNAQKVRKVYTFLWLAINGGVPIATWSAKVGYLEECNICYSGERKNLGQFLCAQSIYGKPSEMLDQD